jgi:dTDP-4-dehydrorhamnose reductase
LRLETEQKEIAVVVDQIAAPTWARAYAEVTAELLNKENIVGNHSGIYHLSAAGQTTRYQWARKITDTTRELSGKKTERASLRPITTAEFPLPSGRPPFPLPAERPLYTVMDNSKIKQIFEIQMHHWEDQLVSFLSDLSGTAQAKGIAPIR